MRLWRICARRHAHSLSGEGGLYASGRWHTKGRPIVYAATHPALAVLEALVHAEPSTAPADLRLLTIETPDDIVLDRADPDDLRRNWQRTPAPRELQELGDRWLDRNATALLLVPSAVLPSTENALLNPAHEAAPSCTIVANEPFSFDARLLG